MVFGAVDWRKWDIPLKKNDTRRRTKRPDVQAARSSWMERMLDWEATRLVFLDESGLNTKMALSKLKTHLRELAPRSIEEIISDLGLILDLFAPVLCKNFFKHANYAAL